MGLWQTIRDSFRPLDDPALREPSPRASAASLAGERARVSSDAPHGIVSSALGGLTHLAPAQRWRDLDLSARTLDRISPTDLVDLLADVSPDISRAVWDFLRFCNPGYAIDVLRPSGRPAPQPARDALARVLTALTERHTDLNVIVNRLFMAAYLRGGLLAELVLDADARQTLDLATPDPATLSWQQASDPLLGTVWQWGQRQAGQWVRLDDVPTVVYVPIDPLPGQAEGRSPAHAALTTVVFALALLQDVRRVVQQQGYPRLDLEIVLEKLAASMPADAADDPATFLVWVNELIDQVTKKYESLEPDDAYIHADVVKVNRPVGAVDASSLGAIDKLMGVLERQSVRALKTMPLLFAIPEGMSEGNAARQWEAHAAGIKSMQHLVERALERLLTLALEAQGVLATVEVRFAELRSSELLRDAQAERQRIANAREKYSAGWISQDQAAREGAGVDQADAPEPRAAAAAVGALANAEPGSQNSAPARDSFGQVRLADVRAWIANQALILDAEGNGRDQELARRIVEALNERMQ